MGTPVRTSLLLDIKSKLEKITVDNGYKTTVDTVQEQVRTRDDVKPGELPYVAFGIERESYTHDAFSHVRVAAEVVVVGYIDGGGLTWAQKSDGVNDLIDDIIVAMISNFNNSDYAVQCKLLRSLTDEWDPDQGNDIAACVVYFEVIYNRELTTS